MRVLIVCQVLDAKHPILGFFHRWVEEFAKHVESVVVIASSVGEHNLSKNVSVYSLGKERGNTSAMRMVNFFKLIISLRNEYDTVFVHMIQEAVLAGGLLWKLFGKKIGLWYVHGTVSLRLRVAALITDAIFTTSPESCRLKTKKVHTLGHGIDVDPLEVSSMPPVPRIVTIGRISPSKKLDTVLDAFSILKEQGIRFEGEIVGGPAVARDVQYAKEIQKRAEALGVTYHGPVPHEKALGCLDGATFFISASETGSVDKAVLEAASRGVVSVFSSAAFAGALNTVGLKVDGDPRSFAALIQFLLENNTLRERYREEVYAVVLENHSLEKLIPRIVSLYG